MRLTTALHCFVTVNKGEFGWEFFCVCVSYGDGGSSLQGVLGRELVDDGRVSAHLSLQLPASQRLLLAGKKHHMCLLAIIIIIPTLAAC